MDDMMVQQQCNKNSVYVLNSSYRYRDFDMIELFGSPAGRALTVNNRTAAEMHSCSKQTNGRSSIGSISNSTSANNVLQQQPLLYHPLQLCGFSETCSTISTSASSGALHLQQPHLSSSSASTTTASNKYSNESNDHLKRYNNNAKSNSKSSANSSSHHHSSLSSTSCANAATSSSSSLLPTSYSNNNNHRTSNSKMAKIWKLFDEDRIGKSANSSNSSSTANSNNGTTSNGGIGGLAGSDIFSRCQRRNSNNNNNQRQQQKQQSLNRVPSEEKSTKDLYNEAAQLLGIKCSLSDSCRCIDCQSQYFDCDDYDSYSEYSDKSYDPEDNFIVNQAASAAYFSPEVASEPATNLGGAPQLMNGMMSNSSPRGANDLTGICHHQDPGHIDEDDASSHDIDANQLELQLEEDEVGHRHREESSEDYEENRHVAGVRGTFETLRGHENGDSNANNRIDQYLLHGNSTSRRNRSEPEDGKLLMGNDFRGTTFDSTPRIDGICCQQNRKTTANDESCEIGQRQNGRALEGFTAAIIGSSGNNRTGTNEPEANGNLIA
ncbi:putative uncharacterized protein DDB_G0282133 isoform X2 [Uranotaenia lowii]|uniref:putative uncharacterized protein DDB_G0282133 isoform X2 n=1 Tax=Uranotaenia lowii TaxID=190385 RepID=UPI002479104A|nr:putative uncharacterized protein DDB_G0282133 isoform X2 [Uranotaenia lowii]